jgi:hypothetical protein
MLGVAMAAAIGLTTPSVGFFDGPALVATCSASGRQDGARQALCLGYIAGAVDQLVMLESSGKAQQSICPTRGLTLEAAVRAVLERADWAAAAKGVSAADFVRVALEDAFPCRGADIM